MTNEPPVSLWPDAEALGPVTDLYQLTMMAGYAASGLEATVPALARFDAVVFIRSSCALIARPETWKIERGPLPMLILP